MFFGLKSGKNVVRGTLRDRYVFTSFSETEVQRVSDHPFISVFVYKDTQN